MKKKLNCILLVDDDSNCNFFHRRLLNKMECTERVEIAVNGIEALNFLESIKDGKHPMPAIIFLDINMPVMDGWEFLEAYKKLDEDMKAKIVLVMLTTSLNPNDKVRAEGYGVVNGFNNKFLTEKAVNKILAEHFPEYV
jgi:CheY-like chemotaxis protein